MRRLKEFLNLPAAQQRRVLQTGLLLVAFRLGLWLIPFRILRKLADCARRECEEPNEQALSDIARNVVSIAQFIPEASCLTQALTAQVLLRREGFDPKLQIGVARDDKGTFKAHAWIECQGKVIVGDFNNGPIQYATMQSSN